MDNELILYSPPEIFKKDIKHIDTVIGSVFDKEQLLYNLIDKEIKLYIEKNNIKQYKNE
jgi:hypothetical protein